MADGQYPSLVSKSRDINAVTNPIFVEITNGTASNSVAYVDDTVFVVATDYVSATGYIADETAPDSVDEGDVGIARMTLDRKQLFVLVDSATDSQRLSIDATGAASVDLPLNTETNPVYVYTVNTVVSGNEVHDYDTAASVASDATSDHDYTVVGTTFLLSSVIASGSGSVKFEIQTGPLLSLATVAVGFLTGRQGDTQQVFFDPAVEVPGASDGTVRVIRTNRQGAATDVYSTIIGSDVA